jgi:hypothetical protein
LDLTLENDQTFKGLFEGEFNLYNNNYISTFDDDVEFSVPEANGQIDFYGDAYGSGVYAWQITMWDSSKLTMNGSGILTGEPGSVLQIELYTDMSNTPSIPNGRYEIVVSLTSMRAGTVAAGGKTTYEGRVVQYGSRYLIAANNYYREQAPLAVGTVDFSLVDKNVCSIKVDAVDDLGFKIKGEMSGEFKLSDKSSSTGMPF